MLTGKELEMYKAQKRNVRVVCKNGETLEGYCSEFSAAYDNDEPEIASITLEEGRRVKNNEPLYPFTEIFETEIEKIEYL